MVTVSSRSSPTMRRRRLGSELRRLRESAELKILQVATALECSTSKISRIETGQVAVRTLDLRAILNLYEVEESHRETLIELARQSRAKTSWQAKLEMSEVRILAELEAAAVFIRTFGGLLVPGLLQTAGYARAVIGALRPELSFAEVENRVELRLMRQAVLTEEDPPSYWAIIDDAALRRPVGGRAVMREQLFQLIELAQLPNVTVQVLPYRVGAHAGMCGDFGILSFSEPTDQDIVYLEHNAGDLYLDHREQKEQIARHLRAFDYLIPEALRPDESILALAAYSAETDESDVLSDPA